MNCPRDACLIILINFCNKFDIANQSLQIEHLVLNIFNFNNKKYYAIIVFVFIAKKDAGRIKKNVYFYDKTNSRKWVKNKYVAEYHRGFLRPLD